MAAFSQVVVKALSVVSELKLSDAQCEHISLWLIDGDGVDFPGLSFFFNYGEKVSFSLNFLLYLLLFVLNLLLLPSLHIFSPHHSIFFFFFFSLPFFYFFFRS